MASAPHQYASWFWSLRGGTEQSGGLGSPSTAPPDPCLCLHARLPAVYSPSSECHEGPGCHMGTVPFLGPSCLSAAPQLGAAGLGEGGCHRWPFSHSGFSKGYSPGWAPCLLLLSDTSFLPWVGLGWDRAGGRGGQGHDAGSQPCATPCHSLGVSLCQIPAGLPISAGAVGVSVSLRGSAWCPPLSLGGFPGPFFGPQPPTLFCGTSGLGQGGPGEAALPQALPWLGL